jgi:hypothetical protein
MKRLSYFLVAVTMISALPVLTACSGSSPDTQVPDDLSSEEEQVPGATSIEERDLTGDEIVIESVNAYQDLFGEWIITGLIRNVSDFPVGNVILQVQFFDASGSTIYESTFVEAASGLVAGEGLPFRFLSMQQLATMDRFEVSIVELSPFSKDVVSVLTHGVNMAFRENDLIQVMGEIENPSDQPILVDRVVASIKNKAGELLSAESCDVCVRYLEPGERGPFRVLFYGTPTAFDYSVYISAVPSVALAEDQTEFLEASRMFTDSLGWFHILGEVRNNGVDRWMVSLLSTIYGPDGDVLDVSATEVSPMVLASGDTGYFDLRFGVPSLEPQGPPQVDLWKIQTDRMQTGPIDENVELIPLTTSVVSEQFSDGRAAIEGIIVNDSGEEIQATFVTVLIRDQQSDKIIGLGEYSDDSDISPGGEINFTEIIDFDVQVADANIQVTLIATGILAD